MVVRWILYIGITILVPTLLACKTVKAYRVIRVIDGDTIKVEYNGKSETIRLIGVDTPETVHHENLLNHMEKRLQYLQGICCSLKKAIQNPKTAKHKKGRR